MATERELLRIRWMETDLAERRERVQRLLTIPASQWAPLARCAELRRLRSGLENWIWTRTGFCNHACEYATYTEIPDDSVYWTREASEARLGPHEGTLPWWDGDEDER